MTTVEIIELIGCVIAVLGGIAAYTRLVYVIGTMVSKQEEDTSQNKAAIAALAAKIQAEPSDPKIQELENRLNVILSQLNAHLEHGGDFASISSVNRIDQSLSSHLRSDEIGNLRDNMDGKISELYNKFSELRSSAHTIRTELEVMKSGLQRLVGDQESSEGNVQQLLTGMATNTQRILANESALVRVENDLRAVSIEVASLKSRKGT